MRWWSTLRLRIRSLCRRDVVERELDAELQFHLDELTAEHAAAGLSPREARRAALREMGGVAQYAEECRDARRVALTETTWQDLRFGARLLARHPAFTVVTVMTLALGIGFNTLAFSAARALLFARLPVDNPDRLVLGEALRDGFDPAGSSLLEFGALRGQAVFAGTAVSIDRSLLLRGTTDAAEVHAAAVSPLFFETLGTAPALGRGFSRDESQPAGPPAVLLAYGFWQRRFGSDANVIGQSLRLDDRSYTIVGVMPRGFDYPNHTEAWIALDFDPDATPLPQRTTHSYIFVARLAPGVSRAMALDRVKQVARELESEFPQTERGWSYGLLTMRQWSIGDDDGRVTRAIEVLLVAVGFLLLICSVNAANLLLVRGVVRERELAIRVGLGASTARVTRQLFTEGMLLSIIAAAMGIAVAWGLRPMFQILNPIQPHSFGVLVTDFELDTAALIFCLIASALTSVIFTAVPAIKLGAVRDPIGMLRERERRTGGGAGGREWLRALVVVEIGLAVALSFGGALLTKSFYRLWRLDPGFRAARLLSMELPLSASEYPSYTMKAAFVDRALGRIRALPGVESGGATTTLPMQEFSPDTAFTVEGHPPRNPSDVPIAAIRHVTAGYGETLGLTLLKGRLITEQDRADTQPVAVISEELARQAFGVEDPIGKRIRRGRQLATNNPWIIVVGLVRDVKEDRLNFRIARPVLYVPFAQRTSPPATVSVHVVVRAERDPSAIANAIRASIAEINPYQPIGETGRVDRILTSFLSADRFSAQMMTLLAAVGLFLCAIGLYSVIAYSVAQRTAEIGLRVALGARPGSVMWLVAREGALMATLGLAISLPLILAVSNLLAGVLFSVRATDPAILAALGALVTVVTVAGCAIPAWRALSLDPVQALLHE